MNDVSHHEATMRFLYGYVVQKNVRYTSTVDSMCTVLAIMAYIETWQTSYLPRNAGVIWNLTNDRHSRM